MDDSAKKPVATEENQVLWKFYESECWSVHEDEVTGKPVAYEKGAEKPAVSSIFLEPQLEHAETNSTAEATREHYAYFHAVV